MVSRGVWLRVLGLASQLISESGQYGNSHVVPPAFRNTYSFPTDICWYVYRRSLLEGLDGIEKLLALG